MGHFGGMYILQGMTMGVTKLENSLVEISVFRCSRGATGRASVSPIVTRGTPCLVRSARTVQVHTRSTSAHHLIGLHQD